MNNTNRISFIFLLLLLIPAIDGFSQKTAEQWTLRECIDYAREHNIQILASRIASQSGQVELSLARAQLFPSLVFSSNQGWAHQKVQQTEGDYKSQSTYTGSYSLNGGLTLFNGNKLNMSVEKQKKSNQALDYNVEMTGNDIEIAVTEAYLQILYANESLKTNRQTLETSAAQVERVKELFKAGSVAISDVAQLEAQYSNDQYRIVQAENALALAKLQLKQLLELEPEDHFDVYFPEVDETNAIVAVPALEEVYHTALEIMPEMKSSRLNVETARLNEKIAAADKWPSLSLSASIGTNHDSRSDDSFGKQLNNRLNESVGVGISLPISRNRQVKSAVEKAKLQTASAQLDALTTRKNLLRTIESLHQDALSAQSRYIASKNSLASATQSYNLVQAQFDAGMQNTVELLTEKNNYLSALQEQIQAKYQTVLSIRLLNFYRNLPIEL